MRWATENPPLGGAHPWALRVLALAALQACSPAPREDTAISATPLRTDGRWFVDPSGTRVKLAAVNWYGAESEDFVVGGLDRASLDDIAAEIAALGMNAVRLPWSNELVETDPPIDPALLSANPGLSGLGGMACFDAVVEALTAAGLYVVLDNHVSSASWCCSDFDGNGLWYTDEYPESAWLADWSAMAARYVGNDRVVGAELRNELRSDAFLYATWGGDPSTDWHGAAEQAGAAVLAANPNLLVFVDGIFYARDLSGVDDLPVELPLPDRLAYAAHDYSWFHGDVTAETLAQSLDEDWAFIVEDGLAPVWVSEFGTCNDDPSCLRDETGQGAWFEAFTHFLAERDFDWAWWALNGTQSTGEGREHGSVETYGLLDPTWLEFANPDLVAALQALQP